MYYTATSTMLSDFAQGKRLLSGSNYFVLHPIRKHVVLLTGQAFLFSAGYNFLLHVPRNYCIVRKFEVRDAATFGRGAQLRREAEHF